MFRAALEPIEMRRVILVCEPIPARGQEGMRTIGPLLDRQRWSPDRGPGRPSPSALMGWSASARIDRRSAGSSSSGPDGDPRQPGSASTSEVIAASLRSRAARVIGTQSCGCALGVLRYRRLRNGGSLAISEVGLVSGLGRRIEGEGVRPDVAIELRLQDLRQGVDPVLDAAVRELSR